MKNRGKKYLFRPVQFYIVLNFVTKTINEIQSEVFSMIVWLILNFYIAQGAMFVGLM